MGTNIIEECNKAVDALLHLYYSTLTLIMNYVK